MLALGMHYLYDGLIHNASVKVTKERIQVKAIVKSLL